MNTIHRISAFAVLATAFQRFNVAARAAIWIMLSMVLAAFTTASARAEIIFFDDYYNGYPDFVDDSATINLNDYNVTSIIHVYVEGQANAEVIDYNGWAVANAWATVNDYYYSHEYHYDSSQARALARIEIDNITKNSEGHWIAEVIYTNDYDYYDVDLGTGPVFLEGIGWSQGDYWDVDAYADIYY